MTTDGPQEPGAKRHAFDAELLRGAAVNVLALLAKLIQPLMFVLLTWMFGPAVMGLYFLATSIGEMATSAVTSGYTDATMIYGSRYVDRSTHDEEAAETLYQVLGNSFCFALGTGVLFIVLATFGADALVASVYPEHPEVAPALRLLAWSLPFSAISQNAVSATKIHMRMEYDAGIMAFARPLIQLGSCAVVWMLGGGIVGLMWATTLTQVVVAALSAWAYLRHFDGPRTLRATFKPKLHKPMLEFAIPQSLNMTLSKYLTRLDVLLLAKFGFSAESLAFYSTAALITSNLREVKLIFSSALAPVAARYHSLGDREALESTLGRVSRWTVSLIIPLLILVTVLRDDLLQLVSKEYTGDTVFMVLLLVPPFLSCAYGLAANTITYTGHSGWTLANSTLIAALNTGLCWVLIPKLGLFGAGLATAIAMFLISMMQLVELKLLEKVVIRMRDIYKPHVALLVMCAAFALVWDPAKLPSLVDRVGASLGLLGLYVAALYALRHEELRMLIARARGRLAAR